MCFRSHVKENVVKMLVCSLNPRVNVLYIHVAEYTCVGDYKLQPV